jgi:hypothetical protein
VSPAPLSREQLDSAFAVLSDRLVDRQTEATVVLFGDAAMMFAHNARTEIDHVDAAPTPRGIVLGAARDAGQQLGLAAHWINDQHVGSLPKYLDSDVVELWTAANLVVRTLEPELLLAMKALAPNRPADLEDLQLLAAAANITDLIDIEVLIAEVFPGKSLNAKTRTLLEPMF